MSQEIFRFVSLTEVTEASETKIQNHIVISASEKDEKSELIVNLNKESGTSAARGQRAKVVKVLSDFSTSAKIIRDIKTFDKDLLDIGYLLQNGKFEEVLSQKDKTARILSTTAKNRKNIVDSIVYYSFGIERPVVGLIHLLKTLRVLEGMRSGSIKKKNDVLNELNKEIILNEIKPAVYNLLKNEDEFPVVPGKKPAKDKAVITKQQRIAILKITLEVLSKFSANDFDKSKNAYGLKPVYILKPASYNKLSATVKKEYDEVVRKSHTNNFASITGTLSDELANLTSPVPSNTTNTVTIINGQEIKIPVNIADRIYSPPVISRKHGKYVKIYGVAGFEVLKQLWYKFDLGEIAHIENVMNGESKIRTHKRVEETEQVTETFSETTEATERELETSSRFELQSEVDKIHKEKVYVDGSVSFSYDTPFMELKTNVKAGYSNQSESELSMKTSYAKDVVEKAVNRINKTVRETNKIKTIRKVAEKNEHQLQGSKTDGSHTIGVYRWVDKVYKGWVENIGKRMVLEFNVPEPASFYIYSKAQATNNKIDVPGEPMVEGPAHDLVEIQEGEDISLNAIKLSPQHIDEYNYLKFAELYKVKGIEPLPDKTKAVAIDIVEDTFQNESSVKAITKNIKTPTGYGPASFMGQFTANYNSKSVAKGFFKPISTTETSNVAANFNNRLEYERFSCSVNGLELSPYITSVAISTGDRNLNPRNDEKDEMDTQEKFFIGMDFFGSSMPLGGTRNISVRFDTIDNLVLAIQAKGMNLLSGSIEIAYERTPAAYLKWQISTYEKIMKAYYELKAQADEALAQLRVRQGIVINGQNPAINKEVVDKELKKHCIDFMYQDRFRGADNSLSRGEQDNSDYPDFENLSFTFEYPEFIYAEAYKHGRIIEFFEQAFEWNFIMYQLYPYFWSRKDRWIERFSYNDPDPLFSKFLSAGSCRVVLPVRPGFEKAVANFLQRGVLWDSSEPQTIPGVEMREANTVLNIIDQVIEEAVKNTTDLPPEGTQMMDIRIPTSLVYLGHDDLPMTNPSFLPVNDNLN